MSENYRTAVVGIVEDKNKILAGQKSKLKGHQLSNEWHIPGGKVEPSDKNEKDALAREIYEETGIVIEVVRFLGERIVPEDNIKAKWYLCKPKTNNPTSGSDLTKAAFFPKSEIFKVCSKKAVSLMPQEVRNYLKQI